MKLYKSIRFTVFALLCVLLAACNGETSSPGRITPTATMISPADGATNVNVSAMPTIEVQFNIPVENVNSNTLFLMDSSSPDAPLVAIGAITSDDGVTYSFKPVAPLKSQTLYMVGVNQGIVGFNGEPLSNITFGFTTGTLESWTRQAGASDAVSIGLGVDVDRLGNSYVTGYTTAALSGQTQSGSEDYFLAKYDASGGVRWAQQVGATGGLTEGQSIVVDKVGNTYVTGYTTAGISGQTQNGYQDYFLAKYDPSGALQWSTQVGAGSGETIGYSVAVDDDGNSYVTGMTTVAISGQPQLGTTDYFVAKYNPSGVLQWAKQVGVAAKSAEGKGIRIDNAGNSYVTGFTNGGISGQPQIGSFDYFIAKYDQSGTLLWTKQAGTVGESHFVQGIAIDVIGNTYVTGYTNQDSLFNWNLVPASHDYFIAKYDVSGILQWTQQVGFSGGSGSIRAKGVSVDSSGNSYVAGYMTQTLAQNLLNMRAPGTSDYFVAKYNPSGVLQSTKQVGAACGVTQANGISVDSAGNSYVVGSTSVGIDGQTQTGSNDYFLNYNFGPPAQSVSRIAATVC